MSDEKTGKEQACRAALDESNFRLTLEIYMKAEGVRPAELPEAIDERLIILISRRLPSSIPAAELGMPGAWRLVVKAISAASHGRIEA